MQRDFADAVSALLSDCSGPSDDYRHDVTGMDREGSSDARPPAPAEPLPDPERAYWWPRFDTNGAFAGEIIVSEQDWGRLATARLLAPAIASYHGLAVDDVLTALAKVHSNVAHLFDSFQGWAVLAQYVGDVAASSSELFKPTIQ